MKQFSVIILTFNEEENIRRCLDSITDFTDDIIIVDSFSTDATLKLCEKYGCRVFQHAFTNQALQFNCEDHVRRLLEIIGCLALPRGYGDERR